MKGVILLDRDGVLNKVVVDSEQGTIDSPLHPSQVEVFDGVPEAIALLSRLGFALAVVTNQPAAAKGKTTRTNLEAVHQKVLAIAQSAGGVISSSHICWHRSEDQCQCRKPKTLMLEEALAAFPKVQRDQCWMVGDGVTDIQAGQTLGLKTVFLGPKKCDACKVFDDRGLYPVMWQANLLAFARFLDQTFS